MVITRLLLDPFEPGEKKVGPDRDNAVIKLPQIVIDEQTELKLQISQNPAPVCRNA